MGAAANVLNFSARDASLPAIVLTQQDIDEHETPAAEIDLPAFLF